MFDFGIPEPAEIMTAEVPFSETALHHAEQITLRDLLEAGSIEEQTIDGLLRQLKHASGNLYNAEHKTDAEKILLTDLNDFLRCAKPLVDLAFRLARQEAA